MQHPVLERVALAWAAAVDAMRAAGRVAGDALGRRLGYGEPPTAHTIDGCLEDLAEIRSRISDKLAALQMKHDAHQASARDHAGAGRLAAARSDICLRQLYEQQLRSTRRTLTAVASHMLALDAARLNRDVVRVLRDGSDCVARAPVGFAYDVMDRLEDQHDETESLVDLMTERPLAVADADVDEELAQLLTPPAPPCDDPGGECVVGGLPAVPGFEPANEKWTPSPYSFSEEAACAASPTPVS